MFRNLRKKTKKNFIWKRKSEIYIFLATLVLFLPFTPYISKPKNSFEKEITYLRRSQRDTSVLKIAKIWLETEEMGL